MDEILSSIRQIIADDDEGSTPAAAAPAPAPAAPAPAPVEAAEEVAEPLTFDLEGIVPEEDEDEGALALSSAQIVEDDEELSFSPAEPKAPIVEPKPVEEEVAEAAEDLDVPELVVADDISFGDDIETDAEPEMESVVSAAAPMPDPDLSSDMADQLLEPTTDAAVKSTFAKLGNLGLGAGQLTIENMIREMLRPLLKEWLDENLPTMVENMVQNEIERLSRGK